MITQKNTNMENIDSLKPEDRVVITIWGPDDSVVYKATGTGYHSLDSAVNAVVENANLRINPEDCVFEISNQTKDVTHKYRLNAHGHLKLII